MRSRLVTHWVVVLALAFLPMNVAAALAQGTAEDAGAGTEQQQLLDAGQLDQLVAPIALYPDSLLAQVLIASTYPLEVVQADRFAKSNKGGLLILSGILLDAPKQKNGI